MKRGSRPSSHSYLKVTLSFYLRERDFMESLLEAIERTNAGDALRHRLLRLPFHGARTRAAFEPDGDLVRLRDEAASEASVELRPRLKALFADLVRAAERTIDEERRLDESTFDD